MALLIFEKNCGLNLAVLYENFQVKRQGKLWINTNICRQKKIVRDNVCSQKYKQTF